MNFYLDVTYFLLLHFYCCVQQLASLQATLHCQDLHAARELQRLISVCDSDSVTEQMQKILDKLLKEITIIIN
jgi:hypothetical protein